MTTQTPTHTMTMRYPATRWQDATPTGSGIVGAMIYGQIQRDTILLNHDDLYYPKPFPEMVDVSDLLPQVRQLIREGQCREAAQVMPDAYAERTGQDTGSTSVGRAPYQPFCSIEAATTPHGPFKNYRRSLDFETGLASVTWQDPQASYTKELFVSRESDVVYLRLRATTPGMLEGSLSLQKVVSEQLEQTLVHTAGLPGDVQLETEETACEQTQTITFTGHYEAFSFGAVGHLTHTGGKITASENALRFEDADEVALKVKLFIKEDPAVAIPQLKETLEQTPGFDQAFATHREQHVALFNRTKLDLGSRTTTSNEELLMAAYDGDVPAALLQNMFEFGRYLLICSSKPGGWPANLQGLWNGDYAPAWNSDIHTDENIQMNYWQALQGQLPETALPLFEYFEKHRDEFAENARTLFNCRGIYIPIAMTTDGREIPRSWMNWTAAAGWIAQHFYDYYLFTGDTTFLKDRCVPWLKDTALFYEDFLVEEDGKLVFIPSLSPENRPSNGNSMLTINATMDVAICKEVLSNLCDACELLEIEAEGVTRWREMLTKLPNYEINEDGAIKEWLHPDFKDNYRHRHQSQIYPVFPGFEITEESDPAMFEACRVAVEKRLVIGLASQTGWSMAHMANIYARLGDGDRALECLEILSRSSLGPNLFTYHNDRRGMGLSLGWGKHHPPFQIDANLGITAAVLEMLVFSKPGMIKLLPARPSSWQTGSVEGIACRGGYLVDVSWEHGKLKSAIVRPNAKSRPYTEIIVKYGGKTINADMASGEPLTLTIDSFV